MEGCRVKLPELDYRMLAAGLVVGLAVGYVAAGFVRANRRPCEGCTDADLGLVTEEAAA